MLICVGAGIVAEVTLGIAHALNDNRTFHTCVLSDLAERFFDGALNDSDTGLDSGCMPHRRRERYLRQWQRG